MGNLFSVVCGDSGLQRVTEKRKLNLLFGPEPVFQGSNLVPA
jgi:hypothetical protein